MTLLSTLSLALTLAPAAGSTYTSEPGRFKATFAAEPAYSTDSTYRWESSTVTLHRYEAKGDSCRMTVLYFDLPDAAQPRSARDLAQQHVQAMTKGREDSILERKQYVMGGLPVEVARLAELDQQSLAFVVVKGDRVYQVVTTGTAQTVQGSEARAFLSSFRVL